MATTSNESVSHLQQLPAEILFRIFNDLDAVTLFFSLAQTCRRLRTLVHTNDRLSVDFTSVSKPQFHRLLNLIDPHNVTSLTWPHQPDAADIVKLSCSHDRRRPFDRLRSLALHQIAEADLRNILQCVQLSSLSSLTLKPDHFNYRRTRTPVGVISTIIANASMRRLEIDIAENSIERIQWPSTNTIKQLKIHTRLRIAELSRLLNHLPHLQMLSINNIAKNMGNEMIEVEGSTERFRQLTSLTVTELRMSIDHLEYVLFLTSSLTHLKLVGYGAYEDGKRWEQFIQLNLPHLKKFEFFFTITLVNFPQPSYVESILSSFRSSFWLEQKKWIVQDEESCNGSNSSSLELYSLPICVDKYTCQMGSQEDTIYYSFITDSSWMDNITTLKWYVNKSARNGDKEKVVIRYGFELTTVDVQ